MRVLVTGATGFVGHYVVKSLLEAGHHVSVLVRPRSVDKLGLLYNYVHLIKSDHFDVNSLRSSLKNMDAVVNLIAIIKETPEQDITFEKVHIESITRLSEAMKLSGVKRLVHVSANGIKENGTGYQQTKYQQEQIIKAAGLDYTFIRPSLIFGESHGRMSFTGELAGPLKLAPVFPLFGNGQYLLQPVHVENVADFVAKVVGDKQTIGETYEMGGPEKLTYKQILKSIAGALGKPNLPLIPVPLPLVKLGVTIGSSIATLPITPDQLTMLVEGNSCQDNRWVEMLNQQPIPFSVQNLGYLRQPVAEKVPEVFKVSLQQ
jgi:uncharacterized protein YbjT (DUF2867 family)